MKPVHYVINTKTIYFIKNLEELYKRRDAVIEYKLNHWMEAEYSSPVISEERKALIKKFCERKVVSIWEIIKNTPPTDPKKQRTYERHLKRIKEYCMEETLEDVLEEVEYAIEDFRDAKDLPEEWKPF